MRKVACLVVFLALTSSSVTLAQQTQQAGWQSHFSNMSSLSDQEKYQDAAKEGTAALRELEKLPASKSRTEYIDQVLGKMSELQQQFDTDSNWVWSEYSLRCLLQAKEFVRGRDTADALPVLNNLAKVCAAQGRNQEAQTYAARAKFIQDKPRRDALKQAEVEKEKRDRVQAIQQSKWQQVGQAEAPQ